MISLHHRLSKLEAVKSPDRSRLAFISYPLPEDAQISGISVTINDSVYRFEGSDVDELLSRAEQELLPMLEVQVEFAFVSYVN